VRAGRSTERTILHESWRSCSRISSGRCSNVQNPFWSPCLVFWSPEHLELDTDAGLPNSFQNGQFLPDLGVLCWPSSFSPRNSPGPDFGVWQDIPVLRTRTLRDAPPSHCSLDSGHHRPESCVHESLRERLECHILAQLALASAVKPSWHAETTPVQGAENRPLETVLSPLVSAALTPRRRKQVLGGHCPREHCHELGERSARARQ
jgi:hypothetical protein